MHRAHVARPTYRRATARAIPVQSLPLPYAATVMFGLATLSWFATVELIRHIL